MTTYSDIEMKIIQWSEQRRIIPNSTPATQLLKAVSEMGELADATIKNDKDGILDAVGDVMVCLVFCHGRPLVTWHLRRKRKALGSAVG